MSQVITDARFPLFEEYCKKMDIDGKEIRANISDIEIKLKVLSTPQSQAKGFMEEPEPAENTGLLFIYDEIQPLSFWMKNVKFPLDIIFFDDYMKYIDHYTMDPGQDIDDSQQPQYHSKKPARFAVELPAGWCEKNMKPNCKLSF
jgi:uncharacterized membrane protein (UPF0127 family)